MSISFTADIHAFAQSRGLKLTREDVETISANLNSITTVEGTTVTFTLGRDRVVPLDEAVAAMAAGYGSPVATTAPDAAIPAGATRTERAVATNAALRANADTAKRDQAAALVRQFGKPPATLSGRLHPTRSGPFSAAPPLASLPTCNAASAG